MVILEEVLKMITINLTSLRENMCDERDYYDPDCVDYISMDVLSYYVCNRKSPVIDQYLL